MTRARDKASAIVASFASTGIDDNADANAITIDSSENVLVGKTALGTANDGLQVKPVGELAVTRDGNHSLILNRKSSDGDIALLQKDGSTIGSIKAQNGTDISIGSVNTELRFFDSADQIIPTTDNLTTLGRSDSRFKDLYLSGGAYIGGTGSANYLDDYEVGTFTPTLIGSSSNPTVSYAAQIGKYTKIGNSVAVDIYLQTNSSSGGSGNLRIAGLPFTAVSGGAESGAAPIGYNVNTGEEARVIANNNGTFCQMLVRGGRTTSYGWANQAISAWSNSNPTALTVSFTYKTS